MGRMICSRFKRRDLAGRCQWSLGIAEPAIGGGAIRGLFSLGNPCRTILNQW
jgi:hypothetical protein